MAKSLVVVESPTKVKTLSRFLGKDYVIKATYGHIKDLPKSKMGVDIDEGFAPHFGVIKGKAKVVDELKKAAKDADNVYIASDPDREGEAIAFHVAEVIGKKKTPKRVLFHEITKKAVTEALAHPQDLDVAKYDAQKARRILDRIVGYGISPLLWERVKYGLSAGRVQSVAVKLVCQRDAEIEAFVPEEYWTIEGDFQRESGETVKAKLERIGEAKAKIGSKDEAEKVRAAITGGDAPFPVRKVEEKERFIVPQPVFKTSTLQQEASRRLRFSPKRTMMLAQKLYEGAVVGKDDRTTGLITYMRTDSVRVADEAIKGVRDLIAKQFGEAYVPHQPNVFKNSKSAQDAHEGIRPADVKLTPNKVSAFLEKDMFALYELIYKRFVASQMARQQLHVTVIDIAKDEHIFVARGQRVVFDGFAKVYEVEKTDEEEATLPVLKEGEPLSLKRLHTGQHFTAPSPYYNEASLIRALETKGIGRPSTYASIVTTIQDREYVHRDRGRLMSTPLGRTVNKLLSEFFPRVIDVDFTAKMEEGLDLIQENEKGWVSELEEFYRVFKEELSSAKGAMKNLKAEEKETDIVCDKCGKMMMLRWGRNGEYLVCSGRPECKNKKNVTQDQHGNLVIVEDEIKGTCPNCAGDLVEKAGRFGRFIACSNYPGCKYTKPVSSGFSCPEEGCTGDLIERVSKKKKRFYGCSRYPECTFATSSKPKEGSCPDCGASVIFSFRGRTLCARKDCGWKQES